ncbi:hypothetical protein ACH4FX_13840 [Streptomyces sp. NPDC018019]|uniref:hypothetical protein n=1 Tax=Streptomyces sp. NPDC018019 TaxID=3365030 RepID=UPI0037BB2E3B
MDRIKSASTTRHAADRTGANVVVAHWARTVAGWVLHCTSQAVPASAVVGFVGMS